MTRRPRPGRTAYTLLTLMFFGYTSCPDLCTTVLADPGRDDGRVIRAYLDRFDAGFIGLTGPVATTRDLAGQVGVDFEAGTTTADLGHDIALLVDRSR